MDKFVEDHSFNNNFWFKSEELYSYTHNKFRELMSLGHIFKRLAELSEDFSNNILKSIKINDALSTGEIKNSDKKKQKEIIQENFYIPLDKPDNSTRSDGIKALFKYFERLSKSFNFLSDSFQKISIDILEKQYSYYPLLEFEKECNNLFYSYKENLKKLKEMKKNFTESINKAIEYHLSHLNKPGKNKNKYEEDMIKKKNEYLTQVNEVEKTRVEYSEFQGHIFSSIEEFERNCTNDLKIYLIRMRDKINKFDDNLGMNESEMKQIEEMDGNKDIYYINVILYLLNKISH